MEIFLFVLLSVFAVFGLQMIISDDLLLLLLGGGVFGLLLYIAIKINSKQSR